MMKVSAFKKCWQVIFIKSRGFLKLFGTLLRLLIRQAFDEIYSDTLEILVCFLLLKMMLFSIAFTIFIQIYVKTVDDCSRKSRTMSSFLRLKAHTRKAFILKVIFFFQGSRINWIEDDFHLPDKSKHQLDWLSRSFYKLFIVYCLTWCPEPEFFHGLEPGQKSTASHL